MSQTIVLQTTVLVACNWHAALGAFFFGEWGTHMSQYIERPFVETSAVTFAAALA